MVGYETNIGATIFAQQMGIMFQYFDLFVTLSFITYNVDVEMINFINTFDVWNLGYAIIWCWYTLGVQLILAICIVNLFTWSLVYLIVRFWTIFLFSLISWEIMVQLVEHWYFTMIRCVIELMDVYENSYFWILRLLKNTLKWYWVYIWLKTQHKLDFLP